MDSLENNTRRAYLYTLYVPNTVYCSLIKCVYERIVKFNLKYKINMLIFFNDENMPLVFVRERHVNFKRVSAVPPVVDPNDDYQFRVSRVERVRTLTENAGSSP